MKKLLLFFATATLLTNISAQENIEKESGDNSDKLVVLWTSGDPEVAEKVCFMYTHAAKAYAFFNEVTLIVWGPSAKLLTENSKLQAKVKAMMDDGVKFEACVACANMYGITDDLKAMGIDVKGMGKPLTNYLKEGYKTLTF